MQLGPHFKILKDLCSTKLGSGAENGFSQNQTLVLALHIGNQKQC
jgi:hypothetical protein